MNFIIMNAESFSFSGLILAFTSIILVAILIVYGRTKVHRIWMLFNLSLVWWGIGVYFMGKCSNPLQTIVVTKIAYVGVIFISVFFYHFSCEFSEAKRSGWILFAYIQGLVFSFLSLSNCGIPYISIVERIHGTSLYYIRSSGWLYNISFFIWISFVAAGFTETLIQYLKEINSFKKNQSLYLFLGFFVGFFGGLTNFFPPFHIDVVPIGNFTIPLYCIIATYAILRHKLLDITVVLTRLSVFTIVYSLILGIPIWLGFKLLGIGLWLLPVICMGVFATAGPSIYLFIQKRAEDRLLQEQRRYQNTLRQASAGMGKIKDLKKLLNMIVYVLTRAIQTEHTSIYIYDEGQKQYVLGASNGNNNSIANNIEKKSSLIDYLLIDKNIIIFEEIKQRAEGNKNLQFSQLEKEIIALSGSIVIPVFIDENLSAIIVMGKRKSGLSYSQDDLAAFSNLANQTSLAIENAEFYEKMKLTQQQLFQAEKMATIGIMADGLSHQINNRFHALGFIAGDAIDTIKMNQKELSQEEMKVVLSELERSFVRVQENVVQGGEIVQGLLRYTRKGDAGFVPVDIDAVLKAALEMVQFKIKMNELKVIRKYDALTIPKVKGNFTQLQEVFFNLIDNGYDAMMQRKNEKKEPGFQPTLIVRVLNEEDQVFIVFEDNGIGVKDEDMHKLFTPFFTTKLSSKKGTGLGLYVIKKIVEDNHGGQVEMISKYMHGTLMKLRLPIAIA